MADTNLDIILRLKDEMSAQVQKAKGSLKNFSDQVNGVKKSADAATKGLADIGKSKPFDKLIPSADNLKKGLLAAGVALAGIGAMALKESSKFENLTVRFKVLLGSMDAAKERMKELNEFALITPFQVDEVANLSVLLETLVGPLASTGDGLKFVGDMAAFAQQPLEEVGLHVGRAVNALKNGLPFGESAARLQELGLLTDGARQRFEAMAGQTMTTAEAMEFFKENVVGVDGTMQELNNTLSGQWSNVVQQTMNKVRELGDSFVKAFDLKNTLSGVAEFIGNLDFTPLYRGIEQFGRILMDVLKIIKNFFSALDGLTGIGKTISGIFRIAASIFGLFMDVIELGTVLVSKFFDTSNDQVQTFGSSFSKVFPFIVNVIADFFDFFRGFVTLLTGILRGDAVAAFGALPVGARNAFYSVLTFMETMVNGVFEGINKMTGKLNEWTKGAVPKTSIATISLAKNFKASMETAIESTQKAGGAIDKEIPPLIDNLGSAGKAAKDSGKDFAKFAADVKKQAEGISKRYSELKQDISDLKKATQEDLSGNRSTLAEAFVEAEGRMKELREERRDLEKQLTNEADAERRQSIQDELDEVKNKLNEEAAALESVSSYKGEISRELSEARKIAAMSELERAAYFYDQEKKKILEVHNEKMAKIKEELAEVDNQRNEMIRIIAEKNDELKKMYGEDTGYFRKELGEQVLAIEETGRQMIDVYNQIAAAKANALGGSAKTVTFKTPAKLPKREFGGSVTAGNAVTVGEAGPETFVPQRSGYILPNNTRSSGVTVVVQVSGSVTTERDLAEKIMDVFTKEMQLSSSLN